MHEILKLTVDATEEIDEALDRWVELNSEG